MGVESYHYVGPFFKCYCPIKKEPKKVSACVNSKCKLYNKPLQNINLRTSWADCKFCSECGNGIGSIENGFEKKRAVRIWDVIEALEERLMAPGINNGAIESNDDNETHCYISNINLRNPILRQGCKEPNYDLEEGTNFFSFESNWTPEADENYLKDNFAKEEGILRSFYGDENVEINWGIINYYS